MRCDICGEDSLKYIVLYYVTPKMKEWLLELDRPWESAFGLLNTCYACSKEVDKFNKKVKKK